MAMRISNRKKAPISSYCKQKPISYSTADTQIGLTPTSVISSKHLWNNSRINDQSSAQQLLQEKLRNPSNIVRMLNFQVIFIKMNRKLFEKSFS